jgi:hypothetical protein
MPGLKAVAAADASVCREALIAFRSGLYGCFTRRADALFDLADAVLTAQGPVQSLVELSQEKAFRRGHGALYDALAGGDVDVARLAGLIASSWQPADEGPVMIAVDTSAWPRPDAVTSPGLCHCYTACRCDGARKTIPGWPFSFAAGLEWGASSWTALLDAVRVGPADDATVVTVDQIGAVLARLDAAGTLAGRPAPVFAFDSGYDLTRITYLARQAGLGVQVLGRVRSDRVFYAPAPKRVKDGRPGRPKKHGTRFALSKPALLPTPDEQLHGHNPRYGTVLVSAWHGLHQKLAKQAGWAGFDGVLPVVAGTVIRIQVQRLPGDRTPEDLWLWHTAPPGTRFDLDLLWKTYLRRFDLEHTFRLLKSTLGWTAPKDDDYEPDGSLYDMVAVGSRLYVVEANHAEIDSVTTTGEIRRVRDISAIKGHITPTAIAYRDGQLYVGNLTPFPVRRGAAEIFRVGLDGDGVKPVARGLTAVLGLAFDRRGRLYALETTTVDNDLPQPGTGRVVRVTRDGRLQPVATGLTFPTGMTVGPDGHLYVSEFGYGGDPTVGRIIRIALHR